MYTLKNIISVLNKQKQPLYQLKHLLDNYNGNDWKKYANYSDNYYKKNLIFRNDNY